MDTSNNTARKPQYWAFRVDRKHLARLDGEVEAGRLRQGWGWDIGQNLKHLTVDGGARRNLRMLQVRQGDRVLIPHLPNLGQVTIVEATQDWKEGYLFSMLEDLGDYGHVFPVKRLKIFNRRNSNVPASLRSTFRNPCRFWRINHLGTDIEQVLGIPEGDLESTSLAVDRWQGKIVEIIEERKLREGFIDSAKKFNGKAEWEWILADALQRLNPTWDVKRTGGKEEAKHGTDVLVKIPDIFGSGYYGVAIQVKDHSYKVGEYPLQQIRKATAYWNEQEVKIVELVVVLIGANRDMNAKLEAAAQSGTPVRIIWAQDVEDLVFRSACQFLSDLDRSTVAPIKQEEIEPDSEEP